MSIAAPSMINEHDSAKYKETHRADPAIPFNSEGGWTVTRPRTTRRPRRVFMLGFTDLSAAKKTSLESLWENAKGGSEIITGFVRPGTATAVNVRFKIGAMPEFIYRGHGGNHRWDVSGVIFEEV